MKVKPSTLTSCSEFYIDDCLARGQSAATVNTKSVLLNMFIQWCFTQGITKVRELNLDELEELEEYRRHLCRYRKPRSGDPLDLTTQRMRLMAVTGLLQRLHYYDIIQSSYYKKFILPHVPRKIPQQIPDEEGIKKILHQTFTKGRMGLRDRAILEVYYASGIRRGELSALDIRDIDFKHQTVSIRKGKGSLDRTVPIASRALDWVKKYIKELRPELATLESGEALFLGQTGKRIQNSKLTDIVGEYIRRSGVAKEGACHLLRHATATHMLRHGADVRYVQELLGHLDISSTQIYTHVTIVDLKMVYEKTHPAAIDNNQDDSDSDNDN